MLSKKNVNYLKRGKQIMDSQVKIDEIDVKILKALLKDARTSFADIARDCGVSTNTIVTRFYKLKQSGVIAGTSLIVNLEDIGYKFYLSIDLNVNYSQGPIHILEKLKGLHNFINCDQVVGNHDIHAAAFVKDIKQIDQIRDLIKRQKGVKKVRITANIDKAVFFPENLLIQPTETPKNG